jgi:hypothetical protein
MTLANFRRFMCGHWRDQAGVCDWVANRNVLADYFQDEQPRDECRQE